MGWGLLSISLQLATNIGKLGHNPYYSGGDKTSVKSLTAYISHNKAKDPINLGAK